MMRVVASQLVFGLLACCLLLAGCASGSADPRQGGLFGYNPKGHEQRIKEREARLASSGAETRAAQDESTRLEASLGAQERQKAEMQKKVKGMNARLAKTQQTLAAVKARDAATARELDSLKQRHEQLSGQLDKLALAEGPGAQAESERLGADIQKLAQEAEALGAVGY